MPNNTEVVDVLSSPQLEAGFIQLLNQLTLEERRHREGEAKLALFQAEGLVRGKNYEDAGQKFAEAIKHLLGPDGLKIPIDATNDGGVRNSIYLNLTMDDCLTAMTCANGVSTCLYETGKYVEALEWATEVDVLHKNARFAAQAIHDWEPFHPSPPVLEFHRQRLLGLMTASDVFWKLGNTGAAAYCRNAAHNLILSLPEHQQNVMHQEVVPYSTWLDAMVLRHPDPSIHRTHEITEPALQVRGQWKKLSAQVHSRIASRMAHSCFIHKSRLYVCGGQRSGTFELYQDLYCLDLVRLDGWRELPSFHSKFLNCHMAVIDGKAYLFRGFASIDFFDLERERWGRIKTHFLNARGGRDEWLWSSSSLTDYTMCAHKGKLYVFGGKYEREIGCNIFAVLDVAKKTWTKLSGTPDHMPLLAQYDVPGARKNHVCWADEKRDKIYVMYGMVDRQAAECTGGEEFASYEGFANDDCWSWDVAKKQWRRERISGNWPCPRAETSVCYNPKIDSAIMFGGYNPALPFYSEANNRECFGFQYFSDTFILDHSSSTPQWRQIITPTFPTYRAQGQLLTDPDTGKMYLFGGYTNTSWIPVGKDGLSKSFGDLWQLVVDVPGGQYENIDWVDEKRTAQLGPWQVCYSCNAFGYHKKCGGSCRGRVFFCSPKCQKDAWAEHREKHGCRR